METRASENVAVLNRVLSAIPEGGSKLVDIAKAIDMHPQNTMRAIGVLMADEVVFRNGGDGRWVYYRRT